MSRTRTVAIGGVGRRCGTTHIALMVASAIKEKGKVAYVSLCKDNTVERLCEFLGVRGDTEGFAYKGISYYDRVGHDDLLEILNDKFDWVVMDFGDISSGIPREYIRSDVGLVVSNASALDYARFQFFWEEYGDELRKYNYCVMLNLVGPYTVKRIRSALKVKAVLIGESERFWEPDRGIMRLLQTIIG